MTRKTENPSGYLFFSRTRKGFGRGLYVGAYGEQQSLCGQMESNCQLAYNSTTECHAHRQRQQKDIHFEEIQILLGQRSRYRYEYTYIYIEAGSFMTWLAPSFFGIEHFTSSIWREGWTCALGSSPFELVTNFP